MMEAKRGDILQATTLLKNAIIKRPRDGAVWQSYALLMKVSKQSKWHLNITFLEFAHIFVWENVAQKVEICCTVMHSSKCVVFSKYS